MFIRIIGGGLFYAVSLTQAVTVTGTSSLQPLNQVEFTFSENMTQNVDGTAIPAIEVFDAFDNVWYPCTSHTFGNANTVNCEFGGSAGFNNATQWRIATDPTSPNFNFAHPFAVPQSGAL